MKIIIAGLVIVSAAYLLFLWRVLGLLTAGTLIVLSLTVYFMFWC
jgi:hypothetical protein